MHAYFEFALILLIPKFNSSLIVYIICAYSTFGISMCLVRIRAYHAYSEYLLNLNPSAYSKLFVLIITCLFTNLDLCYLHRCVTTMSNKHVLISAKFGNF